ncbi:GAF domain-containing protein [Rapidithrix thailandica]|uniref:GAF domain-containing protein n=1 Tax=Rapidithrix thailandica TaxID=413964 RepID=A0AAW9S933_9BACT
MKFFNIGVSADLAEELAPKIRLTNQIALILTFNSLVYAFFSYTNHSENTVLYAALLCMALCILPVFFNFLNLYNLSRVFISTVPISLVVIVAAMITPPEKPALSSLILLTTSSLPLPFIIFHFSERTLQLGSLIFNILQIVTFRYISLLFVPSKETESLYTELQSLQLDTFGISFGVLVAIVMTSLLQKSMVDSEKKLKVNLEELEERTRAMEEAKSEMEKSYKELENARIDSQQREWINKGLAQSINLLRSDEDISILYDKLLAYIIRFMGANQGGLFLVNKQDHDEHMELVACYAYNRKKFIKKRIEVGEGLIGQSYLEKDKLFLTDVPEEYLDITSGLGHSNPRCIVIIPFFFNEKIEAILEIASFKVLQEHEITFLEKVGENIASVISSYRITSQTKKLLETSQQQAEMLRSQEEEMRQNMEEMQATQEEMYRKERQYVKHIEDLEEKLNATRKEQNHLTS